MCADNDSRSYMDYDYKALFPPTGSEGVRAQFVRSVFPTSTFPNHFTIVTVRHNVHDIYSTSMSV